MWMDRADRLGELAFGHTMSILASTPTRLGPVATFAHDAQDDSSEIKVAITGISGEPLEVISATTGAAKGASASVSEGGCDFRLTGIQAGTPIQLTIELQNGASLVFDIETQADAEREIAALMVAEQSANTFTAGTERIAYAADIEMARLMQAMKWETK
jgi:hypothetical protein